MNFGWGLDGHWRLLDAGGPDDDSRFQHSLVCRNDNWAALVCDNDLACRWLCDNGIDYGGRIGRATMVMVALDGPLLRVKQDAE